MRGMGIAVWMLVAGTLSAQTPARADAVDVLVARGRAALRAIRVLRAEFRETTVSKLLRDPIVATGHLVATAPAQVVMEYVTPERKTLSVDATRLVVTWPARSERQELNIASTQKRVQKYFTDAELPFVQQPADCYAQLARDAYDRHEPRFGTLIVQEPAQRLGRDASSPRHVGMGTSARIDGVAQPPAPSVIHGSSLITIS